MNVQMHNITTRTTFFLFTEQLSVSLLPNMPGIHVLRPLKRWKTEKPFSSNLWQPSERRRKRTQRTVGRRWGTL